MVVRSLGVLDQVVYLMRVACVIEVHVIEGRRGHAAVLSLEWCSFGVAICGAEQVFAAGFLHCSFCHLTVFNRVRKLLAQPLVLIVLIESRRNTEFGFRTHSCGTLSVFGAISSSSKVGTQRLPEAAVNFAFVDVVLSCHSFVVFDAAAWTILVPRALVVRPLHGESLKGVSRDHEPVFFVILCLDVDVEHALVIVKESLLCALVYPGSRAAARLVFVISASHGDTVVTKRHVALALGRAEGAQTLRLPVEERFAAQVA